MTNEQANEILSHLIAEMQRNGFGEIVRQANTRVEEDFKDNIGFSVRARLKDFLNNSTQILQSISSSAIPSILSQINSFIDEQNPVEKISVQLINDEQYNLRELPNYTSLIQSLKTISEELKDE